MAIETHGIRLQRDRIGVVQIVIPHFVETLAETLTVGERIVIGLPEVGRHATQHESGQGYDVWITYEGDNDPQDDVSRGVGSLRSSFREEPLESHPNILEIVRKYQGFYTREGKVGFNPEYTDEGDRRDGLSGASEEGSTRKNPFYGVEKYMALEVIWQWRYPALAIRSSVLSRVGKIINSPPGNPPSIDGRSKWLVLPPSAEDRGNVKEITEEYQLLEKDPPKELHDLTE